jgi:putative holliday junction resolvase
MNILGIDYGSSKVGLALSAGSLAMPWRSLKKWNSIAVLIREITEIIKEEEVDKVIVGIPQGLSGTSTAQTQEVMTFVKELQKVLTIPVIGEDERYSTGLAKQQLMPNDDEDAQAAANILQSYLDRRSS